MLTKDEVRHIAKLAKLELTDEEIEKYAVQLSSILDFFGQLQEVNTDDVEETSQVTGLTNVMRKDEINIWEDTDSLLECSSHKVENHCIKIPRIM